MKTSFLYIVSALFLLGCNKQKTLQINYPSGSPKIIWTFETDTLTGTKQFFRQNGTLHSIESHRDGKLDGEFTGYFENGFIARSGTFIEGNLHGLTRKYSETDSGSIELEEYIVNPNGKHYYYYTKKYNNKGELIDDGRFLIVEKDERSTQKSVVFKYNGDDHYDTMKLVVGPYDRFYRIRDAAEVDTIVFQNQVSVPYGKLKMDTEGTFRGEFLTYRLTKEDDGRTRVNLTTKYFECTLDELEPLGTEIELRPDATSYLRP